MVDDEDIDECLELAGACQPVGRCENVPGSYRCSCPPGYELDETGKRCVDKDECDSESMQCQFGCVNLVGGFRCECPIGFVHYFYWNQCIGQSLRLTIALVSHCI